MPSPVHGMTPVELPIVVSFKVMAELPSGRHHNVGYNAGAEIPPGR